MGPLIPLFWTFGDVCPGLYANVDSPVCMLHCLDTTDSSDSTLVQHLLTSWQLAWRPSCCDSLTCIHVLVGLKSGIEHARMLHQHHLVQSFIYVCFSRQINTRITMGTFFNGNSGTSPLTVGSMRHPTLFMEILAQH